MTEARITGAEIRRLRDERGWSQRELADVLNVALGRRYSRGSVSQWEVEREGHKAPESVSVFLRELAAEPAPVPEGDEPPLEGVHEHPPEPPPQRVARDVPPGREPLALPPGQPVSGRQTQYARACAELWEIVASGVGMVGAATRNDALVKDGQIIARDKDKLGEAWGKLAEQNDTFRRMLLSMTEGTAWMQVALVTGTTVSKCYQSHQQLAREQRAARSQQAPPPQAPPDEDDGRLHAVT